ncbi:hypothetical protein [Streptomyces sp. NBC_00827]|uniref:hypothetical protein n=1 Tax=Streptomyces sp. NBC_00827 TaxID=2903677 RepID=UPI00386A37B8|nr:hypothetical protein OG569_12985 [Streptomyces sp. NBC_00827]
MRRLLTVGLVPCWLFIGCFWSLARAGSFTGQSDWARAVPVGPGATIGTLVALTGCAWLLAVLLQPFQVRAVRVLEGYWDRWPATAQLAGFLVEMQRRRQLALRDKASRPGAASADALRRLASRPPVEVLLPTELGNALRAGEISAGERYGLTTLSSWPRIYMQVSDRLSRSLSSTRDALDTAVNLCWSFLALAAVLAAGLYDEAGVRWLPLPALVFAAVAYKGAVTAAQAYSGLMQVVFDLHRFDLLEALHHRLPSEREQEQEVFGKVSKLLAGLRVPDLPYEHGRQVSHPRDADGSAET